MNNRRTILTVVAAALVALLLPLMASAQGVYDPWGRRRDDRDYRRDRDYGRDDYRYDWRSVRDSIRRLNDLSRNLARDLDRVLDRSHEDGTRHEDNLNALAQDFHNAASDLKDSFGDGRNLNRSEDEAHRVLQLGNQLSRRLRHHFDNGRIRSDWSQVSQELRLIANVYGSRFDGYDGYYGRDDDYRRDDRNRRRNAPWWQRIP